MKIRVGRLATGILLMASVAWSLHVSFPRRVVAPPSSGAAPRQVRPSTLDVAAGSLPVRQLPEDIVTLVSGDRGAEVRRMRDDTGVQWSVRLSDHGIIQLRQSETDLYGFGYLADGRNFEVTSGANATPAVQWRRQSDRGRSGAARREWCLVDTPEASAIEPAAPPAAPPGLVTDVGVATIDVLTLYTTDALLVVDVDVLELRTRNAVHFTNNVLACSQVWAQLRLIGVEALGFAKTGTLQEFLRDRLADATTPEGRALFTLRKERSADIVMVMVGSASHEGLAHVAPAGSLKSWWPKATALVTAADGMPGVTFAHEAAHLMGAGHEATGPPSGSYAHAWRNATHYTLMAATGGILVPRFSNPALRHFTHQIGTPDRADNARAMNENRRVVENWATPVPALGQLIPIECQ